MRLNRFQASLFALAGCTLILLYLIHLAFNDQTEFSVEKYEESLEELADRKYVYLDLGANNGDSLENFFDIKKSGGGGNFQNLLPNKLVHMIKSNKWDVYAYEANPRFDESLANIGVKLRELSHSVFINNGTAAWTYDGSIDFYLDTVNPSKNFWGSSLYKNAKDVKNSNQQKVKVPCHEIARIIKQYSSSDIIIAKMDIEGAEYDLLIDLFRKNVLKLVDYLAIEYHPSLLNYNVKNSFFDQLISIDGVKLIEWV